MSLTAAELLPRAKTQGELMAYRKGYAVGLAAGRRQIADELALRLAKQLQKEIAHLRAGRLPAN